MSQFFLSPSGGGTPGDVVGPASSTDNAVVRFDGATGKLIQNSVAILSDAGALSGLTGLTVNGPLRFKRTATAISYVATSDDYLIAVTDTSALRTITLPDATTVGSSSLPQYFIIKDEGGGAGGFNVTITPAAGTIDGAASYLLDSPYEAVTVYSNGTAYFSI